MPFSGKSEAVKIAKERGIPVIRMGDMVWDEVRSRGLELCDENVGYVANEMRKTHSKNIWAQRTVDKIKSTDTKNALIIDGIRNVEEIDFFKEKLGSDFKVIAIVVSDSVRHNRAMSRGREDDSRDIDLIKKRDERELGWGLGDVIKSADIKISNENGIEEFRKEIKKNLDEI